ncbi:MAG: phosphoenolpyruvate carboxykinase (ATP) [Candidatus Hydrogenedens sp.]|nr:phosphoenolpyruvate carboxykinase (ATP) [Candidatus Hydrogenedens sp.]
MSALEVFTVSTLDLSPLGITSHKALYHNLSYNSLYQHETDPALEGLARCQETEFGALNVDTGRFTGRSPKDKYFVVHPDSEQEIWWHDPVRQVSDNRPISQETWDALFAIASNHLNGKKLYVQDGFAGANPDTRLSVRTVTEVAWQAHFCKNMFIRPSEEELAGFTPDWTILNACGAVCENFKELGLRSEVFVAFNLEKRMTLIGGTWYGGEMKKGIFSIMNYFLPLRGIGAFHCSANMGKEGDTALFFGLSGTGKTTLSTDPHRGLIGDDEHGWDDAGIFNFEGGCYAKCLNLAEESEPEIFHAIKRDALLENLVVDEHGKVDFNSDAKTQNTRVSYPLYHIENIVKPISVGGHPKNIIFLTADAFGVLPPVSILTADQAKYQYLSGYTAKIAGTELGVDEPSATFSACYGAAFLSVHPTRYADILGKKMEEHGSRAYLVNTGWVGGAYGVGRRMSIKGTRAIIDAILDGSILEQEFETLPVFELQIPKSLPGVDSGVLNPREAWDDAEAYDQAKHKLAAMFVKNFKKFTDTEEGMRLEQHGPRIEASVG